MRKKILTNDERINTESSILVTDTTYISQSFYSHTRIYRTSEGTYFAEYTHIRKFERDENGDPVHYQSVEMLDLDDALDAMISLILTHLDGIAGLELYEQNDPIFLKAMESNKIRSREERCVLREYLGRDTNPE